MYDIETQKRLCEYEPYTEKDGCVIHCTRERNHAGGCHWPQHRPHQARVASKEVSHA